MGKSISYGAIFGILIAMWEIFAGNFLHQLQLPFKGEILSTFDIFIFSYVLAKTGKRETILLITVVALVIRAFISGTFIPGAVIGLGATGTLYFAGSYFSRFKYYISGLLAGLWAPFFFGYIQLKLLGPEILQSYKILFSKIGLGTSPSAIINFTLLTGAIAGLAASLTGKKMAGK